jgi:hypothetical protein
MASNTTGVRIVPAPGAGSLVSPGGGYPAAPHDDSPVSHDPEQGHPRDASTFSQGIDVLESCVNCGRAFKPLEMLSHNQNEGIYDGSRFGDRDFEI